MHTIENAQLRVSIHELGAELTSIFSKDLQLEYLWQGDPAFWSKQSPVLFPIVGAVKDNTYFYHNRPYQLPRHGFAREKSFSVVREKKKRQDTSGKPSKYQEAKSQLKNKEGINRLVAGETFQRTWDVKLF